MLLGRGGEADVKNRLKDTGEECEGKIYFKKQ